MKTIAKRFSVGIAVGATLLVCGCSRWKTTSTDTPWIGPDQQAIEQSKRHRHYVQSTWEIRWLGTNKQIYIPVTVASEAEQFLVSASPGSNAPTALNPTTWPWKTIVSLSPTIVLLVPSDPVKAKKGDLLGANHSGRSFGNFKNATSYDCGSVVLYNEGMYWFSPDLAIQPQPVNFSTNGTAEIKLPNGKLELSIQGEICKVRRK